MLKFLTNLFFILFIVLLVASFFWQQPIDYLESFINDNSVISVAVFIFLMAISTIFAPLTIIPLVPIVGEIMGSFQTAIYSVIGWFIGLTVAFYIARYLGKPFLSKYISETELSKYKKYIPEDVGFWWIVFLRMIVPVDILSYVFGLLTNVSSGKYLLASLVGIIPFSFIFAYGFEIVLFENIGASLFTLAFIITILSALWYFRKKRKI